MHKNFLPRDNVERHYVTRKGEGKRIASLEMQQFRDSKNVEKKSKLRLITPAGINLNRKTTNKNVKLENKNGKKKQLCGYFKQQTKKIAH